LNNCIIRSKYYRKSKISFLAGFFGLAATQQAIHLRVDRDRICAALRKLRRLSRGA
jgi:hypothetical protein